MPRRLSDIQAIRRFLLGNERPICFISPSSFSLLGLEGLVGGMRFILRHHCFERHRPDVFIPSERWADASMGVVETNNHLLRHPQVVEHLKALGANPAALFLMFDEETEALCQGLGVEILSPPASLRNLLDDKVETVRIGHRAGVPSVPNYLGPVSSYPDLRQIAHRHGLGEALVVQTPYGDSGHTTFFVSNEADWNRIAAAVRRERAVKVMKRIRCRSLTQEACLTRWGTIVGPLQCELIGLPELTSDRGGWCGNELAIGSVSRERESQARSYTLKLGEQLRQLGYRGCFDVDYLIDRDTGALYLGELNPRISGATPLTSLACAASGRLPLVLFHLLEYSDADLDLTRLIGAQPQQSLDAPWSSLIVKYRAQRSGRISRGPRGGIWKRNERGGVSFDRRSSRCLALTGADEALVQRMARPGLRVCAGDDLARIIVRDQVLDANDGLNDRARAWAQGVQDQITLEEEPWQ
jgi:hypothetical protein